MEVRFFLTAQDVWNFQKQAIWRTRFSLILIVVLFIILLLFTALSGSASNIVVNVAPIILLLVVLGIVVLLLRRRIFGGTARRLAAQGEHTITISPEGFRHKNNLSDSLISWQAIKEIKTDAYNLYFMVDSNVAMAHVIPRRAFASPQAADTFLGWAKSYWATGHGMQQPGSPGSAPGYERWG